MNRTQKNIELLPCSIKRMKLTLLLVASLTLVYSSFVPMADKEKKEINQAKSAAISRISSSRIRNLEVPGKIVAIIPKMRDSSEIISSLRDEKARLQSKVKKLQKLL